MIFLSFFADAPKVVPSCPQWLHEKLKCWNLRRQDVDILLDSSKIRNRKRIYTEAEYNRKLGLEPDEQPSPSKSAKVEINDLDLEAQMAEITGTVLEDIDDIKPKSKGKNVVKPTKDANKSPKSSVKKSAKVKTPKSVKSAKNASSTSISSDDDGSFHGFTSDEVSLILPQ